MFDFLVEFSLKLFISKVNHTQVQLNFPRP